MWSEIPFQQAMSSSYHAIWLTVVWGEEQPFNPLLFCPISNFLTGKMGVIITLDNIRRFENCKDCPHTIFLPKAFWHSVAVSKLETTSTLVRTYQYPAEHLKGPIQSICHVDHNVFSSFICGGSALAGRLACNIDLYWGHSVKTVSLVFLFIGQPSTLGSKIKCFFTCVTWVLMKPLSQSIPLKI